MGFRMLTSNLGSLCPAVFKSVLCELITPSENLVITLQVSGTTRKEQKPECRSHFSFFGLLCMQNVSGHERGNSSLYPSNLPKALLFFKCLVEYDCFIMLCYMHYAYVTCVQQSESAIGIHISLSFRIPSHLRNRRALDTLKNFLYKKSDFFLYLWISFSWIIALSGLRALHNSLKL